MFTSANEYIENMETQAPFYLVLMFILTPLVVSRRVKRSAAFMRQKLGTGVKRTVSKSFNSLSTTAKRVARMKNFVKKPKNLLKKPKAPSKVKTSQNLFPFQNLLFSSAICADFHLQNVATKINLKNHRLACATLFACLVASVDFPLLY